MSALATKEQWEAAANALAEWRSGRSPENFPHALGVDAGALREWALFDALDTIATVMDVEPLEPSTTVTAGETAAALATGTQLGVELGLWLATTPEGRAFLEPSS